MTQGPKAVAIGTLVERGEVAVQRASADYPAFLRERIPEAELQIRKHFAEPEGMKHWKALYTVVHDLRSSSASAGYHTISSICDSLETLMLERDPNDSRMASVIELHIDTLKFAISADAPMEGSEEARRLLAMVAYATERLARIETGA